MRSLSSRYGGIVAAFACGVVVTLLLLSLVPDDEQTQEKLGSAAAATPIASSNIRRLSESRHHRAVYREPESIELTADELAAAMDVAVASRALSAYDFGAVEHIGLWPSAANDAAMDAARTLLSLHRPTLPYPAPLLFHVFWHGPLNEQHLSAIRSCFAFNVMDHTKGSRKIILHVKSGINIALLTPAHIWVEAQRYISEVREFSMTRDIQILADKVTSLQLEEYLELIHREPNRQLWANIARSLILYTFGGVWMNLDVFWLRSIDPLLNMFPSRVLVHSLDHLKSPEGGIMASLAPKAPGLLRIIQFMIQDGDKFSCNFAMPLDILVISFSWLDTEWLPNYDQIPRRFARSRYYPGASNCTLERFYPGAFAFQWDNGISYSSPVASNSCMSDLNTEIASKIWQYYVKA